MAKKNVRVEDLRKPADEEVDVKKSLTTEGFVSFESDGVGFHFPDSYTGGVDYEMPPPRHVISGKVEYKFKSSPTSTFLDPLMTPKESKKVVIKSDSSDDYLTSENNSLLDSPDKLTTARKSVRATEEKIAEAFIECKKSGDVKDFETFLFKQKFLSGGMDCMEANDSIIRVLGAQRFQDRLRRETGEVAERLERIRGIQEQLTSSDINIVSNLIQKLYNTKNRSYYHICISSIELLNELTMRCTLKGIEIDTDILALRDEILSKSSSREVEPTSGPIVMYVPVINKVILVGKDSSKYVSDYSDYKDIVDNFYTVTSQLPDIKSKNYKGDVIEINGVEYSKKVFECLVESDLATFISNLNLEMLLDLDEKTPW